MDNPLVTVICIVYNQRKYIHDMIRGIIDQKTNFDVEIIIHDDASSDGSAEILRNYEKKYPGMFKIIYETENQWSRGVKITQELLLPLAKGKYIAFCEGDDFWIDSRKLQEQVDFMEKNPDYVCVAHNALRWNMIVNALIPQNNFEKSTTIPAEYIVNRKFPFLATASKLYRREAFVLDGFFLECGEVGDMCTEYSAILKGKFFYIDKIMSVYRYCSEGSWSRRVSSLEYNFKFRGVFLNFLNNYNDYTQGQFVYYIYLFMSRAGAFFVNQLIRDNKQRQELIAVREMISKETKNVYDYWLDELERVANILVYSTEDSFKIEIENIRKKKYIYGAGEFGKRVANFFMNNNLDYDGFIVSNPDNKGKLFGKEIVTIKEFVDDCLDATIIVAVDAKYWEEVKDTLDTYGVRDYICPLYIHPLNYNHSEMLDR